ncbi:hybrid sensor histidine kinase/response regulator [Sulfuriferula sp. AH1]|uniref:hybrid sensor histidine kinase/response regulator n=1 Tax=Sulfuriferula sp. AH1 TaxID=1985873 RepID=UPI000B3B695B|nr:hybrid sensor histidine kinase/response regulator [Sulfuriferula sp. AH1]ARU32178.1 hybrid sensor histidine kinase/response regulator [Sulfuriferula sp. AH1]
MTKQSDDFQKRLRATFQIEADEHLQVMSAGLIELENQPAQARYAEIVETVFREVHSLKGAARAVNLREVESACQALESVFAALKARQLSVSQPLFDLLHEAIDGLSMLLAMEDAALPVAGKSMVASLTRRFNDVLHGQFVQPAVVSTPAVLSATIPPAHREQPPDAPPEEIATVATPAQSLSVSFVSETVRVSTQKLDAVMRQVEELLSPRLASAQRAKELREVALSFVGWKKRRAVMRPVLRQIERYVDAGGNGAAEGMSRFPAQGLPKLLEYLESEHLFMNTLEERLLRLCKFAARDRRTLAGMSDNLLHDVKEMHLLPFSSLLETLPRVARELAREQDKQVKLEIQGGEIEIDRRILEEMKDPLIHLLRNCIDHGIEPPALRRDKGKPEQGRITIAITQKDGGKIEIMVADDGAGIDAARVHAVARKLGLVSDEAAGQMSEQETQSLIFMSGISTSQIITDISGRGIGLAIVREKVERMGGTVVLESGHAGSVRETGTSFRITLPLMLATFRGVLVRTGEHNFIIPALNVERVTRIAQQDIQTVENRPTIALDGQAVALVGLDDALALARPRAPERAPAQVLVVVLNAGHQHVAFRVDEIVGEQEVLVKALGRQLARVRNVAGASVLGTGQVVAVLNVPDLLKSAVKQTAPPSMAVAVSGETEKQSILVVEDSITSRSLLKNILESAGYRVVTAVDGIDAYTALKTGKFDLIVSDVEMPRMDGFDLTAKVRMDKQFAELPVVLVTALDSREDRERGIDVGANAYIVKSSFDQSNLLEVVQRLI